MRELREQGVCRAGSRAWGHRAADAWLAKRRRVAFLLASGKLCCGDGENGFAVVASVNVAVYFPRLRYKCSFR